MTQIDFYELKSGRFSPDQILCQLSLKAYQNKQSTLLLTNSESESQHIDKSLWEFDKTSFIPHEINNTPSAALNIINICDNCQANHQYTLLINIKDEIPNHFAQFERVIELVHDNNKNTAREHFRFYKDRGYKINHHCV